MENMFMDTEYVIALDLLTAFGVGLLIGIERGWKGRTKEEGDRTAGIRTFALTGILGGVIGRLSMLTGEWVLPGAFVAISIVISVAYFIGAKESDDIGFTTSVALLITFSLGIWAVFGDHLYVLGVAVLVVAMLGYKPVIHKWLDNIDSNEIYAGIKLLIISIILLPLLPNEGYGPYEAINPYWIWWMVVLITGLSFIGYITITHLGDRVGVFLTALTGGLASSTAVTLSLAHMANRSRVSPIFMAGVLIASSIMFIRVLIEVVIVHTKLLSILWLPIVVMFIVMLLGMFWLYLPGQDDNDNDRQSLTLENPFQIGTALKYGVLLGIVLLLTEAIKDSFGEKGIYVLSFVSGLMDIDAITLSLSKLAIEEISNIVAAKGIILASIANTLVKGMMFAVLTEIKVSLKLILITLASGAAGLVTVYLL